MSRSDMLDISSFPEELHFILRVLRSDNKLEVEEAMEKSRYLDWQLFLRFSIYHEISPVLYPLLKQLNTQQQWTPEFVMVRLKAQYTENTLAMLHLRGEMERINSLFAGDGIRTLFLKGPALASMLYSDVSERASGDFDIMVARQDWNDSMKHLVEAGYIRREPYDKSAHHVSYIHPKKRLKVELHVSLHPDTIKEPTFEELWVRRQASELNKSLFTLGNEDMLVYLILYGTRHGWTSLSWLIDIDRMLGQFLNWNRANQLFAESESLAFGGKAFVLSTQLLGTLLPEEAYALTKHPKAYWLAQMALPFIREEVVLYPKPECREIAAAYNRYILATMSFKHKLLYFSNKMSKNMEFLFIPLRPFLWFWRQVKRQTT
jgi:hypothetical protein